MKIKKIKPKRLSITDDAKKLSETPKIIPKKSKKSSPKRLPKGSLSQKILSSKLKGKLKRKLLKKRSKSEVPKGGFSSLTRNK